MNTKAKAKTDWRARFECDTPVQVKRVEKRFADIPAGASMVIVTPRMVDAVVRAIPRGQVLTSAEIRKSVAARYRAEFACPVTTGISLRVVSEYAYSQMTGEVPGADPAPFWRAVDPDSALGERLRCGRAFLIRKRNEERP